MSNLWGITTDVSKDLKIALQLLPDMLKLKYWAKKNTGNIINQWNLTVAKFPNKPCVVMDDRSFTFTEVDEESNRFAHCLLKLGLKPKDSIVMMMENSPEFIFIWLGAVKVGVIPAFLNYNLRDKSLEHCIKISNPSAIIFDDVFTSAITDISTSLLSELPLKPLYLSVSSSEKAGIVDMVINAAALEQFTTTPVLDEIRSGININDHLLSIYTSGTTGLPKAAIITHLRYSVSSALFGNAFGVQSNDRYYCCLPLYHSSGAMIAFGVTFRWGTTIVLAKKFSPKSFFDDCIKQKVTVIQYIGELARYLLNTYPTKESAAHIREKSVIRLAIGNGLRPEIWKAFKETFNIPEIGEFYASTEGNVGVFNHQKGIVGMGAVGKTGPLLRKLKNFRIVKFDLENEVPLKNEQGFCIQCAPGESGELISEIKVGDPLSNFKGYIGNNEATSKKIIRDAFVKGDAYFRTGDILSIDERGYWYFHDRIGDTFRWKGENVSTMEVSEAISPYPSVLEANVYGVPIPGTDGNAGMASLVVKEDFDPKNLHNYISKKLPSYAIPLFLRLQKDMQITGTFKHQKVKLRKQGFNPSIISDPIYYLSDGEYKEISGEVFSRLMGGKAKL